MTCVLSDDKMMGMTVAPVFFALELFLQWTLVSSWIDEITMELYLNVPPPLSCMHIVVHSL